MNINVQLQSDFRMMVKNPADSACKARALTQAQFKVVEPMVRDTMNHAMGVPGCKQYTDEDFIKALYAAGMPIDFTPTPAEYVLEVALYAQPKDNRRGSRFLAEWLKNQGEYNLVRAELSQEELEQFDFILQEDDQRLVLATIAVGHDAVMPRKGIHF